MYSMILFQTFQTFFNVFGTYLCSTPSLSVCLSLPFSVPGAEPTGAASAGEHIPPGKKPRKSFGIFFKKQCPAPDASQHLT